jgi:iron complex outermembrane recepter protein
MSIRRTLAITATALLACASTGLHAGTRDLTSLDLTDLMQMDVTITSAARRAQAGGDAAAAVFVLTREDIRRSGADSIPELLRVVPGMQVARINNQSWMVTARGFSSRFANKLLVLVDGRSIYTHNFSGVLWEDQHVPLEEIERIEVVRGPGGALWGANAVNGIINIITRNADQVHGLDGTVRVAADDRSTGMHLGGKTADLGHYRAYVEAIERDSFERGLSPWERLQAGGRFDGTHLQLQADVYDNQQSEQRYLGVLPAFHVEGGAVSAAWQAQSLADGQLDLQSYYSWTQYTQHGAALARESALGLDLQFSAPRVGRHLVAMGAGYRNLRDDVAGLDAIKTTYLWPRATQNLWSLYLQDEIHFLNDDLRLTVGAKLEGFKYTGNALQPNLRGIWHVDDRHAFWAAVSNAVRTPARFDLHGDATLAEIPGMPPVRVALVGNPAAQVEHLRAYEAGWRWRPTQQLSFDLTLFEHRYRDLLQAMPSQPYFDVNSMTAVQPYGYVNGPDVRTRGAELAVDWRAMQRLRVQGSASSFRMNRIRDPQAIAGPHRSDAERTLTANVRADVYRQTELDLAWRWVAERPAWNIPSYTSLDLRLAWRPTRPFELELTVDNLLDKRHVEFFDERGQQPGAVLGRTASAKVKWHLGKVDGSNDAH